MTAQTAASGIVVQWQDNMSFGDLAQNVREVAVASMSNPIQSASANGFEGSSNCGIVRSSIRCRRAHGAGRDRAGPLRGLQLGKNIVATGMRIADIDRGIEIC